MPHKHHPMFYLGLVVLLPVQSVFSRQASPPASGIPSASQKAEVLLHHGYDHSRQSPMSLSLAPENRRLYWRQAGQKKQEDSGIPLPEDFTRVDAGIATGHEQLVLSGIAQNGNGFVAALNLSGQLMWRDPSLLEQGGDHYRFYDLALSESKHRLFAAGARNGQGVLLVVDYSDTGHPGQALTLSPSQKFEQRGYPGVYRQVIAVSDTAVVAIYHDGGSLPTIRLDKWFFADHQWQYLAAFCPMCSTAFASSAALKANTPGESFFYISASENDLNVFLVNASSGDLLDAVNLRTKGIGSLSWNATSTVETPAFLSIRTAVTQGQKDSPGVGEQYQEALTGIARDLSETPRLVIMNRGALLGISGQNTRHAPLVLNLHRENSPEIRPDPSATPAVARSIFWPVTYGLFGAAALISFNKIKTTASACYNRVSQYFHPGRAKPESLASIRQRRLEHFGKNFDTDSRPDSGLSPERPAALPSFGSMGGSDLSVTSMTINRQNENPGLTGVEKDPAQFRQQLKQNLASVISSQKNRACHPKASDTVTKDLLAQALAKVLLQRQARMIFDKQTLLPEVFTLAPIPPDQFCFYHAIGQAFGIGGQPFFHAITHTAQQLLQDSPELTALINNFSGGEGAVEEIAAMGHVEGFNQGAVNEQVWGHVGLLPFLCWYLEMSVVVVTPGTWMNGAGALYFMPDGDWELMGGNSSTIESALIDLHQSNPELLILQHDGFSHWGVLRVSPLDTR